MTEITEEELGILRRLGEALKVRRKARMFRPNLAGRASDLSETYWRRLEGGYAGTKLTVFLRAISALGVGLDQFAGSIEEMLIAGLSPAELRKAVLTRDGPGRPKKGESR